MSYFFSTPVDIDIVLDDTDSRQMVDIKTDKNRREKAPLYMDGESVRGSCLTLQKGLRSYGARFRH
jgi:vacuolar protein sorting-associated protein 26